MYNRSATGRRLFAIVVTQSRRVTPFGDEEEPLGQPNATGCPRRVTDHPCGLAHRPRTVSSPVVSATNTPRSSFHTFRSVFDLERATGLLRTEHDHMPN